MTGVVLDHVSALILFREDAGQIDFFSEKRPIDVSGGGALSCDISLTPDNLLV